MNVVQNLIALWPVIITYLLFNLFLTKISDEIERVSTLTQFDVTDFERFFYGKSSVYSNIVYLLMIMAKLNFVAFLIYFGYRTVWYNPIILIILSFGNSIALIPFLLRFRIIKFILTLLQFLLLPILGVLLWYLV